MDRRAPSISKQVQERNLSLSGTKPLLCPWWEWRFVLVGGSTHNGHILTKSHRSLSPSPTCSIPLYFYSYFIYSMDLCYYDCICFPYSLHSFRGVSLPPSHIARVYLITYSSPLIFVFYPSLGFMLLCIPSAISVHCLPLIFASSLPHCTSWT